MLQGLDSRLRGNDRCLERVSIPNDTTTNFRAVSRFEFSKPFLGSKIALVIRRILIKSGPLRSGNSLGKGTLHVAPSLKSSRQFLAQHGQSYRYDYSRILCMDFMRNHRRMDGWHRGQLV